MGDIEAVSAKVVCSDEQRRAVDQSLRGSPFQA